MHFLVAHTLFVVINNKNYIITGWTVGLLVKTTGGATVLFEFPAKTSAGAAVKFVAALVKTGSAVLKFEFEFSEF